MSTNGWPTASQLTGLLIVLAILVGLAVVRSCE